MKPMKKIGLLAGIAIFCTTLLAVMYIRSERAMRRENPFIRSFITGTAERAGEMALHNTTLYFAGSDGTTIYLSDSHAPLQIFALDTLLKTQKHYTIELEDDKYRFKKVQVQIADSSFYVFDGTVPIIFKGNITNWKAKIIMHPNDTYFLTAKAAADNDIIIKEYRPKQQETVIGKLSPGSGQVAYAPNLLQKQFDGLFDVDGTMLYSNKSKKFIYLYYYRNQFMVTNDKLDLAYRGSTIDTNTVANLKVSNEPETGKKQLASPGEVINKIAAVRDNLLFVNSTAIGRYESKKLWKTASIIDVYNINTKEYLSSFYVYNGHDAKLRDMLVLNSRLYVLVGHEIQRYELGKQLKDQE